VLAAVSPDRLSRNRFHQAVAFLNQVSPRETARACAIDVDNLVKRFPNQSRDVIHRLSFTVPHRQCVSLLGPSGCGKTTLLRLLMGIEQPSGGRVSIDPSLAGHLSYVFQEPRLVPWRTSLENVRLPLELGGTASETPDEIEALLGSLGLGERVSNFPRELSGGMQMRVSLARALITKPKVLLLDEPFAALDERTRFRLQDLLLDLRARLDLQYVFVTHSISEAVYLGDRVLLMDRTGQIDTDQTIEFDARDQSLKLTPLFNDHVSAFARRFTELEAA
jgi:NitT/TauT family transport system ATP-binding protein